MLQELTGKKLNLVHLIGGGVQNDLLCQWIANALGIPVIAGPVETTSVGNIIFQLKAKGIVSGIQEGRKLCANSFTLRTYEPNHTDYWDEKYQAYLKSIKSN